MDLEHMVPHLDLAPLEVKKMRGSIRSVHGAFFATPVGSTGRSRLSPSRRSSWQRHEDLNQACFRLYASVYFYVAAGSFFINFSYVIRQRNKK